jgi:hypothetical protein
MSRSPLYSTGLVQLPIRVLLLRSPRASRQQVPCSASRVVSGAHRVVGPGTHQGSGPREVHTTTGTKCGYEHVLVSLLSSMSLEVWYRQAAKEYDEAPFTSDGELLHGGCALLHCNISCFLDISNWFWYVATVNFWCFNGWSVVFYVSLISFIMVILRVPPMIVLRCMVGYMMSYRHILSVAKKCCIKICLMYVA